MPDTLLTVLKLCFLALLYLFFIRAIRVVWTAMSPAPVAAPVAPPAAAGRKTRRVAGPTLLRVKVLEPSSMKGQMHNIGEEITLGRASSCSLPIEDTFVSQLHARIFHDNGQIYVEDLGSTNGTFLNRKKVTTPTAVRKGDRVQVGKAVMELVK